MKAKRMVFVCSSMILMAVITLFWTTQNVQAKSKVVIKDYEVDNYGKDFKVKLSNKTKRTITVSRQAYFKVDCYKYVGYENDDDDGYEYDYETRTLKYKPKKTVKIKSGKTKWVYYKKTFSEKYMFEDDSYAKVSVGYRTNGKNKTVSGWFEFETFD